MKVPEALLRLLADNSRQILVCLKVAELPEDIPKWPDLSIRQCDGCKSDLFVSKISEEFMATTPCIVLCLECNQCFVEGTETIGEFRDDKTGMIRRVTGINREIN